MKFFVAVTRLKQCWRWQLINPTDRGIEPFGRGAPYIMMPLPELFLPIYTACRAMHAGDQTRKIKKVRRARS